MKAELILYNGRIHTMEDKNPLASAVAVKAGKFIAVGEDKEIMKFLAPGTKVIDLKRKTAIPGINDSHTHLIHAGLNYNRDIPFMYVIGLLLIFLQDPGKISFDYHIYSMLNK